MTFQQSPYLRQQRNFPTDSMQALGVELDKSYIDIAQQVNDRTIGIFPLNFKAVTGNKYFISGSNTAQQSLRQIYSFSDSNLTFNHGINFNSITNFISVYGEFYDGTYWQNLPYVDVVNVTNQINVKISSTQVIITKGGGSPPSISNGLLVLEWLSKP